MNRTKLTRRTRQLHKWLGLVVAIQVVLWIGGGLIMASLDLQQVRGVHYAAETPTVPLSADAVLVAPDQILRQLPGAARQVQLRQWMGQPVYLVQRLEATARPQLVSAKSGLSLSPLDESMARRVAERDYIGPGQLIDAQWLDQLPGEARGRKAPLWKLRFDDAINTVLYVSADSGTVVARRNDWWRVFDVVWMLHIMDYDTRDDFNHPLLIVAAASALLFALSGVLMLILSLWPRRGPTGATRPGPR